MSNEEKRRYKSFFTSEGSLGAFRSRAQISAERALAHQCGCRMAHFFPCGTAFAAHDWRDDGSSALNGTLSFENTINPAERNKEGELPASWTKNGGDAKGQVELTGVRGISENIYGALVESGKGNAYESSVSITGRLLWEARSSALPLSQEKETLTKAL